MKIAHLFKANKTTLEAMQASIEQMGCDPDEQWGFVKQGLDGSWYLEKVPDEVISQKVAEGVVTVEQVDLFRDSYSYEIVKNESSIFTEVVAN